MALYTIGDLHLSLSGDHAMDVFPGWERYVGRIEENWRAKICADDTVVLPGDTSWGMSLEGALADFKFLESLPGKKIMLKGNHDYWWTTKAKMEAFFSAHGLKSLQILNNNCVAVDGVAVCGSRGWLFETGEPFDDKIINREAIRLELSIGSRATVCAAAITATSMRPDAGGLLKGNAGAFSFRSSAAITCILTRCWWSQAKKLLIFREIHNLSIGIDVPVCYNYKIVGL